MEGYVSLLVVLRNGGMVAQDDRNQNDELDIRVGAAAGD